MKSQPLVPEWIRTLTPYPPGKPLQELEREYGISDSIKIASNENPLGPSPQAVAALAGALADLHRYPEGDCYYLRHDLAAKLGVSADNLLFGNGSNELIELIVRTFLPQGASAVIADQAFVVYRLIVQACGGRSIVVPLRNFTHDLEAMAAAVEDDTRIVFLANPNNPTGTIFRRSDWERFLAAVPDSTIIVVDEAYAEFVADGEYPDSLAAIRGGRAVVTLRTFSKIYGLAGLRVGYGVADPALIALMNRVRQPFNVNSLAQIAARAALADDEHVQRSRECNRLGMSFLTQHCARLGCAVVPSQANFLLVRVGDGAALYESLLREGVIVRPMGGYGLPDYLRVTVGTAAENQRFVAALEKCLEARTKRAVV